MQPALVVHGRPEQKRTKNGEQFFRSVVANVTIRISFLNIVRRAVFSNRSAAPFEPLATLSRFRWQNLRIPRSIETKRDKFSKSLSGMMDSGCVND